MLSAERQLGRAVHCTVLAKGDGSNGRAPVLVPAQKKNYRNANFPVDEEGRTYHLGTKKGEVANRILSVGSEKRALMLSEYLEPPAPGRPLFVYESGRGFLTISGSYRGVPVSICSTLMGTPNMDFVVRENRAVVDGQMAFIRLGTCGALQRPARLGDAIVASPGSIFIRRDPDAFTLGGDAKPYIFSLPVPADPVLTHQLQRHLAARLGEDHVREGLNATADSFYSSQGRVSLFDDRNEQLLSDLIAKHPAALSLEMETFHLLDLARCSKGTVVAAACVIALADRTTNDFLDTASLEKLERACGVACIATLAACHLQNEWDMSGGSVQSVWDPLDPDPSEASD
ncbi:hypothetical protein N2152v2_004847 [Parachlorella kessleri]